MKRKLSGMLKVVNENIFMVTSNLSQFYCGKIDIYVQNKLKSEVAKNNHSLNILLKNLNTGCLLASPFNTLCSCSSCFIKVLIIIGALAPLTTATSSLA